MAYRPNYLHDGYVMPHFETKQEGEFFKFAYDHGMEGARFDSLTGQWAAQLPRLYMHLRLFAKLKDRGELGANRGGNEAGLCVGRGYY